MGTTLGGFQTNSGEDYPTLKNAGVPVNGVDEVQRLAGTAATGQFKLTFVNPLSGLSRQTLDIPVLATAVQVRDALLALNNVPAGSIAATGGALGTADVDITFQGELSGLNIAQLTVQNGTTPPAGGTITPSTVTAGVQGTKRGAAKGSILADTDTPGLYQNSGTSEKPTWTEK